MGGTKMNGITQGYRTGLLLAGSLALALGGTTAVATPEVQMQIEYGGNGGTFPTTTVLIEDNDTNDRTAALGRISFTLHTGQRHRWSVLWVRWPGLHAV